MIILRTFATTFSILVCMVGVTTPTQAQILRPTDPSPAAAPVPAPASVTPGTATPATVPAAVSPPATSPETQPGPQPQVAGDVTPTGVSTPPPPEEKKQHWYEKLRIRGYVQFRYNRLPSFDENDDLLSDQDRSIGENNGFFIRRARVILSGDVHDRVSIYVQPDFASTPSGSEQLHVAILRDWYADIYLDEEKEFRFRVGQSKVPYGFENLQSSQNRLALDRSDPLNSAVKDERDLGVFFYWAPSVIRKRFKELVETGLKGTGDYGVVGLGVYNGQTANRAEKNENKHVIARVTWPFLFGSQFVEVGAGGYYGKFNVTPSGAQPATMEPYATTDSDNNLVDARAFGSFTLYPQPFGLQAEYNFGEGPQQGESVATEHIIDSHQLQGGYVQAMYKLDEPLGMVSFIPYARYTFYDGGKKTETNAPQFKVKELEVGLELQIVSALEITLAYMFSDRTSPKAPYEEEVGQVTRVQLQANF